MTSPLKPPAASPRDPSVPARRFLAGLLLASGALLLSGRVVGAIGALGAAHALFCTTAALPNHRLSGPLARNFSPPGRAVWLTIDDGPHPDSTPAILEVLRRHGARATFFLIGRRAERHPELVRAIVAAGHSLGNHTYSHPSATFWTAGPRRIAREIDRAARAIAAAGVAAPVFFRPPVGMANFFVAGALRRRGLVRVGWSARGFDTRPQDPDRMVDAIVRRCRPGGIVLFHELGATAGAAPLDRLLTRLRAENFSCELPSAGAFADPSRPSA